MFYATGLPGWMRSGPGGVAPAEVPASEAERQSLQDQVEMLQSQLDEVKKRLAEFQAASTEK
jgi:chaperonin cofactor prefoldin